MESLASFGQLGDLTVDLCQSLVKVAAIANGIAFLVLYLVVLNEGIKHIALHIVEFLVGLSELERANDRLLPFLELIDTLLRDLVESLLKLSIVIIDPLLRLCTGVVTCERTPSLRIDVGR